MRQRKGRRRRSKLGWVRALDRREIHGLAGRLARERWENPFGLSDRQEWLWDQIILELAYRKSHAGPLTACYCWWCSDHKMFDPEPDPLDEVPERG